MWTNALLLAKVAHRVARPGWLAQAAHHQCLNVTLQCWPGGDCRGAAHSQAGRPERESTWSTWSAHQPHIQGRGAKKRTQRAG